MRRPTIYWIIAALGVALGVAAMLLRAGHARQALAAEVLGALLFAGGVYVALAHGGQHAD